jgi:ATP-dependent Lon protease
MVDQLRETGRTTPVTLPLLPLPGGVVVPGMVVTIAVESAEARAAVAAAADADERLVLVPRLKDGDGRTRFAAVGTIARIEQRDRLRGGRQGILVRGLSRAVLGAGAAGGGDATLIEVTPVDDQAAGEGHEDLDGLVQDYRAVVEGILGHRGARSIAAALDEITDPGQLADTAVYAPDTSTEQKVQVLEALDVRERLELVLGWARETLAELDVRSKIRDEVTGSMEKRQREYILREQLKAIRAELREIGGQAGDEGDSIDAYRARVAELPLPAEVRASITAEVDRLERTGEQSPEQSWIRTWLDRVLEVPWGERSTDALDLDGARRILDADHTGLDVVKERLIEQLAVRKLRLERGLDGDAAPPILSTAEEAEAAVEPPAAEAARGARRGQGAILALVGPPGVGKTSLGESVARALGRRFVRVALGGVRDEAEIRGHRRTYVGAQPGRIVRALTEAGTMNPVILLDELDKVGGDWRGDPSAALLEVLDPAQNHTFRDHYLELDLDLSDVLFIATANVLETIPGPLLDRLEVVHLDGYTDEEKVAIARDHLLPRQLTNAGLAPEEVAIDDDVLRRVVEGWTREAGVRQLERQLGTITRKAAVRIAGGEPTPVVVTDPAEPLGRQRVVKEDAMARVEVPGVATGLAVTGVGGDVLFVEVARTGAGAPAEGEGQLRLTGQLGDVMKESAAIALSFLRSNAAALGLDAEALASGRFHVHFPAGAVPKDGPSAGVTMTTALASLVSGRTVRKGVGMTGEVTLHGKVLPIGGVKQKVLAAHRAGLDTVLLPRRNEADVDDVPEAVRQALTIHLVDDVREVLALALED